MTAAASGHAAVVGLLLESGAEIDAQNKKGATSLMVASLAGRTEVVEILLEKVALM